MSNQVKPDVERCNMGVLFLAVYRAELNTADLLGAVQQEHEYLESAIGQTIPTFEALLEKFQKEGRYTPISVYAKENQDIDLEENTLALEDCVFSDERLTCIPHVAETTYLIALSYNLLTKIHLLKEHNISIDEWVVQCANQAMEDVLDASQAMDYRFSENGYAQEIPVMAAICPQVTSLEYLDDFSALQAVHGKNGFDGVRYLALFKKGIMKNLLSLSTEYADASYNYLY